MGKSFWEDDLLEDLMEEDKLDSLLDDLNKEDNLDSLLDDLNKEEKTSLTSTLPKLENKIEKTSENKNSLENKNKQSFFEDEDYIKKKKFGKEIIDNDKVSWNKFSGYTMVSPNREEEVIDSGYIQGLKEVDSLHKFYSNSNKMDEISEDIIKETEREILEKRDLKENPLDTDYSKNAVISPDGRTLNDYLILRRKPVGKGKYKDEVNRILEKGNEDKDLWKNERYVKRVAKQKKKEKAKKEKLNKKSLQRATAKSTKNNIRKNKYESQILKSLGITRMDLNELVSPRSSLTEREKAKLLSVGYFGKKEITGKNIPIPRSMATIGDLEYLYFLEKFRFANASILSIAVGKSKKTAYGQLKKLYNLGLVNKLLVYGAKGLWYITETGLNLIGSDKTVVQKYLTSPIGLSERLYVNHVAACLWKNSVNALDLEDFPYHGREFNGEMIQGETLLEEALLFSSMNKKLLDLGYVPFQQSRFKGERIKLIKDFWEIEWRKWENNGKTKDSPELEEGNEFMYMIFTDNDLLNKYVLPDLVVQRPRSEDGSPNSIAVEIERQVKPVDEYMKKLMAYQSDTRIYKQVVYITPNNRTARNIIEAAEKIHFERFNVIPPMDLKGPIRELDSWLL